MNIFLSLILAALVLTLFYISSQRKKSRRKPSQHSQHVRDTGKLHKEKTPASSLAATPSAEAQRKAFLESYPVLTEVSYFPIAEGVSPRSTEDMSPEVREAGVEPGRDYIGYSNKSRFFREDTAGGELSIF